MSLGHVSGHTLKYYSSVCVIIIHGEKGQDRWLTAARVGCVLEYSSAAGVTSSAPSDVATDVMASSRLSAPAVKEAANDAAPSVSAAITST
jgi:hypothetical protein